MDDALAQLARGEDLAFEQMAAVIDRIMGGEVDQEHTVRLLGLLADKGETAAEVAGAASAMRRHMTRVRAHRDDLIDTCGTGGDGAGVFNISTAAALVAAASGAAVAKHGNRSVTSKSGSANVLAELGLNLDAPVEVVERSIDELGIGFCFAPRLHPAMRHVAEARQRLGRASIFNLLGPLCNPASAPRQLLGVGRRAAQGVIAEALQLLGTRRALIVSGDDGLDELTLAAPTTVLEVTAERVRPFQWEPETFGLRRASLDALRVEGPAESAALIREVFAGAAGPARDIVVLNAAAALCLSDERAEPAAMARRAAEAIDSGAAASLLARLVEMSRQA